jgi:hypothetical protein
VKDRLPLPKMPPRRRVLNTEEQQPQADDQINLIPIEEVHDGPQNRNNALIDMDAGSDIEEDNGWENDNYYDSDAVAVSDDDGDGFD